jgi:hypothetical protein
MTINRVIGRLQRSRSERPIVSRLINWVLDSQMIDIRVNALYQLSYIAKKRWWDLNPRPRP